MKKRNVKIKIVSCNLIFLALESHFLKWLLLFFIIIHIFMTRQCVVQGSDEPTSLESSAPFGLKVQCV